MPNSVNLTIPDIYLGNDWYSIVELFQAVAGVKIGLTDLDGAATGYLAMVEDAPNAVDADLNLALSYLQDEDPAVPAGKWFAELQSSGAVDTALAPYVGQNMYAIVRHPAGARAVAKVKINKTRFFTVK